MDKYFRTISVLTIGAVSATMGHYTYKKLSVKKQEDQVVTLYNKDFNVAHLVALVTGVLGVGGYFTLPDSPYSLLENP